MIHVQIDQLVLERVGGMPWASLTRQLTRELEQRGVPRADEVALEIIRSAEGPR